MKLSNFHTSTSGKYIQDTSGALVAEVYSPAQAREIAHRCNVHDELVAALEDIAHSTEARHLEDVSAAYDEIVCVAAGALAKAKGGDNAN